MQVCAHEKRSLRSRKDTEQDVVRADVPQHTVQCRRRLQDAGRAGEPEPTECQCPEPLRSSLVLGANPTPQHADAPASGLVPKGLRLASLLLVPEPELSTTLENADRTQVVMTRGALEGEQSRGDRDSEGHLGNSHGSTSLTHGPHTVRTGGCSRVEPHPHASLKEGVRGKAHSTGDPIARQWGYRSLGQRPWALLLQRS